MGLRYIRKVKNPCIGNMNAFCTMTMMTKPDVSKTKQSIKSMCVVRDKNTYHKGNEEFSPTAQIVKCSQEEWQKAPKDCIQSGCRIQESLNGNFSWKAMVSTPLVPCHLLFLVSKRHEYEKIRNGDNDKSQHLKYNRSKHGQQKGIFASFASITDTIIRPGTCENI